MASIISAGTTSGTSLNLSGDTSGVLQLATNGSTTAITVDTSQNVGIGTASPSARLDVRTTSSTQATFTRTGQTAVCTLFQSSADTYLSATNSGASLILATQDTERMRIDSSGNVGIGTSSPTVRLEVAGAARLTNGNLTVAPSTTTQAAVTICTNGGGTFFAGLDSSTGGTFGVGNYSSVLYNGANTPMVFFTNATERMRIFANGTIGLGTNSGTQDRNIGLTVDPDAHSASVVPSSLKFGGTPNFEVRYVRNSGNVFNNGFLRFSTHIGGVFAGVRMNLDVDGNLFPEADGTQTCGTSAKRWSAIWAVNGTIQTSDERKKTEIADSSLGLNFITALKPVSYKWKVGGNTVRTNFDSEIGEDGQHEQIVTPIAGKRTHYGLLAQQVKEVLGEQDFGGFVYDQDTDTYALRYDQFISPLIKAVQELKAELDVAKAEIQALKGAK